MDEANSIGTLVLRSVAVVAVVLTVLVYLILRIRHTWPSLPVKVITTLSLISSILVSPLAVDTIIQRTKPTEGIWWASVDPGMITSWLPALVAGTFGAVYQWRHARRATFLSHQESRHAG